MHKCLYLLGSENEVHISNCSSDPDPDPDWLCVHGGKLDSNPDSDHLSHVDYDPGSNPYLGPGARVSASLALLQ